MGQFHPALVVRVLYACFSFPSTDYCAAILLSVMHNDHVRTGKCYHSTLP